MGRKKGVQRKCADCDKYLTLQNQERWCRKCGKAMCESCIYYIRSHSNVCLPCYQAVTATPAKEGVSHGQ